ncbi:MAG: exosortase/archaeosortase family protein [Nitrososphaerales archaeon]
MTTHVSRGPGAISTRHAMFVVLVAVSVVVYYRKFAFLVAYAWSHDSSSQTLIIPLISLFLIYSARKRIFARTNASGLQGIAAVLTGGFLSWAAGWTSLHLEGNESLSLFALSLVVIWIGAFLLCYGAAAARAGAFPLLFLLLMIPLPDPLLNWLTHLLQQGSTETAYLIFRALGIPVLRRGFLLSVPGVTIEVAKECSSIRSSMALLITCLLAAHLYLRTLWKIVLFALLSLPMAVVKNGIRIATLTLLSVYVNPGFLTGRLHHQGGIVFFFLALLMLWPVLRALRNRTNGSNTKAGHIAQPRGVVT